MTTLAEKWESRAAEAVLAPKAPQHIQGRRDYMGGAMDAVLLVIEGRDPKALLAECLQFGRAIGTAAERA